MSAPIRNEEPGDDLRQYMQRGRLSQPGVPDVPIRAPAKAPSITDAPPMALGLGGPNIDAPRQSLFGGDLAIKDLRRRLTLDPDMIPQPPSPATRELIVPWIARLAFVLILAGMVAFGVTVMTIRREAATRYDLLARAVAPVSPARLVIEGHKAFANEPIPLGIKLDGASGEETLTLVGLATGTKLTAGAPLGLTGWQLSARDAGKTFARAPKDYVGIMDAAIDLRSPRDRLVDSQFVRLEWMPKKEMLREPVIEPPKPAPVKLPASIQLDPEEIATLIKRGVDFLQHGDVASARLFMRRAATAGSAQAALALGSTYDPVYLSEQGVLGLAPDTAQARSWYEKAVELGSVDATRRLERLSRSLR
ncbi:MAG: hypothetical protein QOI40_4448 [Alphaproteobacteria bacterium]|jgi:hypothetical protein|nr:hypothetical protein [Alphaproteobacteria bacterium]